jgi:predicted MFS family arabinose efflux permease
MAICALYGFTTGTLVSLPPTVYVYLSLHKRGMIGTRMGMGMCISALGILLGAPATGWILEAAGFTYIWVFGGLLLICGGVIMAAGRLAKTGLSMFVKT